jgi:hypothetical protein
MYGDIILMYNCVRGWARVKEKEGETERQTGKLKGNKGGRGAVKGG